MLDRLQKACYDGDKLLAFLRVSLDRRRSASCTTQLRTDPWLVPRAALRLADLMLKLWFVTIGGRLMSAYRSSTVCRFLAALLLLAFSLLAQRALAQAPATPSSLSATAQNGRVVLGWAATTGATTYNLYRSTTAGGEGTTAYKSGITTAYSVDATVTNGTPYYYKLAAVNASGTSAQMAEVTATPSATLSVIRVNCASGRYVDTKSNVWAGDYGYAGGAAVTAFDPEDRLTSAPTTSGGTLTASYDGDGLRVKKSVPAGTTYFLYDGGSLVAEETYSGTSASLSNVNGWAGDGLRARLEGSVAYDFIYDPQGSVVERQTAGTYTVGYGAYDQAVYEGYGALRQDVKLSASATGGTTIAARDPVGFGGQYGYYTDTETGLLCLTHRYYDPGTGKFINRDPIGYEGGQNLYGFADGNPVNESDPDGTTAADASEALTTYRKDIIHVATAFGIQPELLAGVVWNEMNPEGWLEHWNYINRQASIAKFAEIGKDSFGITQVTKFSYAHPDPITNIMVPADFAPSGPEFIKQRKMWANQYDSNSHQNLVDSARFLQRLASRSNRYPNSFSHLTSQQMAIVLTEYNKKPTNSPANSAKPSHYGQVFLRGYPTIMKTMYPGK